MMRNRLKMMGRTTPSTPASRRKANQKIKARAKARAMKAKEQKMEWVPFGR